MIIPTFKVKSDIELNVYHFTPNEDETAPVIVFTHPTGFTAGMYSSVVAHLRGFNVFGIDIRCHGLSECGNLSSWSAFDQDLSALFEYLKDKHNTTSVYGVGISSGASAHILHSANNPDSYKALALFEPILFKPNSDLSHREYLAQSARKRRSDFGSKNEVFTRFKAKGALSQLSESALALYAIYGFKESGSGVTLSCKKENEEAIYLSGAANGVWESLSKLKTPTLVVNGECSNTISEEFAIEVSKQVNLGSHLQMSSVGHFTLYENPKLGAEITTNFFRNEIEGK